MSSFRDLRKLLLLAYCNKFISDTEFFLLYDSYTSKNPDFSYDTYPAFSLDDVPEAECKAEFRVLKQDLPRLREALRIPASFKLEQRSICDGMEGRLMHASKMCLLPLPIQRHHTSVWWKASLSYQSCNKSSHRLYI